MGSAATMEAASAVEATPAADRASTVKRWRSTEPSHRATRYRTANSYARPAVKSRASNESRSPVKSSSPVKSRSTVKSVEPRSRSDEHSARKPARTVVAIWRACVRIVIVISVGAYWRPAHIRSGHHGPRHSDADANRYSLRLRIARRDHQNAQHRENSQISHIVSS